MMSKIRSESLKIWKWRRMRSKNHKMKGSDNSNIRRGEFRRSNLWRKNPKRKQTKRKMKVRKSLIKRRKPLYQTMTTMDLETLTHFKREPMMNSGSLQATLTSNKKMKTGVLSICHLQNNKTRLKEIRIKIKKIPSKHKTKRLPMIQSKKLRAKKLM